MVQDGVTGHEASSDKAAIQAFLKGEEVGGIGRRGKQLAHGFRGIDPDRQSGFVPGGQLLQAAEEKGKDPMVFKLTGGLEIGKGPAELAGFSIGFVFPFQPIEHFHKALFYGTFIEMPGGTILVQSCFFCVGKPSRMTGGCLCVFSSAPPDTVGEGIGFFILPVSGPSVIGVIPGMSRIGGAGVAGAAVTADEATI